MRGKSRRVLAAVVAALVLVAGCNKEVQPQLSETDFTDSLSTYGSDVSTVLNEAGQDLLWLALDVLRNDPPPIYASLANAGGLLGALDINQASPEGLIRLMGGVGALADVNLLTGRWVYDPTIPDWVEDTTYSGDDLVLVWDFQDLDGNDHTAELTFDWNYGAPTVEVTNPDGTTMEAPQDMNVTMVIDGTTTAGQLRVQADWYSSASCGTIAEPTHLTVSGEGGASSRVGFNVSVSVSDTRVETTGHVEVSSGGDGSTFDWNVYADGRLTRGADCFAEDFDATSGHVNFRTTETAGGDTSSFEFNTDFSLNFDAATQELVSADLSNGYVKVNGAVAVTFSGTLDDSNHNCVPGENVTLNFADRSTSLESYLIDELGATPGSCP